MKKLNDRTAVHWQILLYVAAVLLLVATSISIWLDRNNIATYYNEKRNEKLSAGLQFSSVFEGSGTQADPYHIASVEDLSNLGNLIAEGRSTKELYFLQMQDLDLSGQLWSPLGTEENPFWGIYDGNGKSIQNLCLNQECSSFIGVFNGGVRNLRFIDTRIEAEDCAVIANRTDGQHGKIINCIVSNVIVAEDADDAASAINNLAKCSLLCVVVQNAPDDLPLYSRLEDIGYVAECTYTGKPFAVEENLKYNNNEHKDHIVPEQFTSEANEKIRAISAYEFSGNFNLIGSSDENGILSFSDDRIYEYNDSKMDDLANFLKVVVFYCALIALGTAGAIVLSKYFGWEVSKCVFYVLMLLFAMVVFLAGMGFRDKWIVTMLYDGTAGGKQKYFTDFTDILVPAGDPYTRVDTYYTSIYPPLISAVMAVLQRFIPIGHMTSSMTIRNSQMGNLIYLIWIIFWMIVLYEMVLRYKAGKNAEKILFFFVICSSYPMIDCLERGNVVFVAAICMAVYLYNYRSESFWLRQLAFFALSGAAGVKIYPAVLGILLLKEKRYADTFNCLAMGIVVNLLPSAAFRTGFSSISYMLINAVSYVDGNAFIGGKIDLSHLLQIPREVFGWEAYLDPMQYYDQIVAALLILTVVIVLFSRLEDWKIYMLFAMDLILLASFSPHYYITYTLAPLMLFLDSKPKAKGMSIVYAVLFAGILMTCISPVKYPVAFFAPTQSVWHMTLVTGFFLVLLEIVLLTDGMVSCTKRAIQYMRKYHA